MNTKNINMRNEELFEKLSKDKKNEKLFEEIYNANINIVHCVLRKIGVVHNYEDILCEGQIALWKSILEYRDKKDIKFYFRSYAYRRVFFAIKAMMPRWYPRRPMQPILPEYESWPMPQEKIVNHVDLVLIRANEVNANGRMYSEEALRNVKYRGTYYDDEKKCLMLKVSPDKKSL